MITVLKPATEGSSYIIEAQLFDEQNEPVMPTTVSWSLRNRRGEIVNNRQSVFVSPDTEFRIVLTRDDLLVSDGDWRHVTVKGEYDSSAGSGLSFASEVAFEITDLLGVPE